jgi:threonine synthase
LQRARRRRRAQITPLKTLGIENGAPLSLLELSNGPTLAFKDMAMQLLGNLFEYALEKHGETLNILGATSGDTGSAAEYAMRGKKGIRVFMLSPHQKMSAFQTAQMFSLQDPNIFNLAVEGNFDDCQDIVKAVSNDHAFKAQYKIGTVNSINWARVVAQVVYYFKGYFAATKSNDERVSFTVPSGNFGNVCAGHIARMMGLPIEKLVVATNENDVLDEFFRTGIYRVRKAAETYHTSSPSMDISKASNFERFVFDLLGPRSGARAATVPRCRREGRFRPRGERRFRAGAGVRLRVGPQQPCGPGGGDPRRVRTLRHDDRHPYGRWPEGGARASAAGHPDDRAGDGAADQVRRNDPRSAAARAGAAGGVCGARVAAAAF